MASPVDLVGILFIVWGGLTMVIGVSTLALGVGALALLGTASRGGGRRVAATITAAAFITIAIITILWGLAHVILGISLGASATGRASSRSCSPLWTAAPAVRHRARRVRDVGAAQRERQGGIPNC